MKKFLFLSLSILFGSLCFVTTINAGSVHARAGVQQDDKPQTQNPESAASRLIDRGKGLYRAAKFQAAIDKFEEALKLEPENDEALGLAAVTAFRLDNQPSSREFFRRRAELANQKASVRAFCYYRVALTYWREVHDMVSKYGEISDDRVTYRLPDDTASKVSNGIQDGLEYVEKALAITSDFAEAYNVRNLLHAEAGLIGRADDGGEEHRQQSLDALRRAIDLAELQDSARRGDVADFSQPTFLIGEVALTEEQEGKLQNPMLNHLEGGRPIRRVRAYFPSLGSTRRNTTGADSKKGDQQQPAAVSPSSFVKIEVLVSTGGDVVFAHVVDGNPKLTGSALLAARSWKFEPARFEGRPVQVSGIISFEKK